jgi:hypothetical protein
VSGTFTCANADFAFVDLTVTQRVGLFTITGFGSVLAHPCDGESHAWSVDVDGSNGRFAGGKASVDAFMFACGPIECATDEVIQTIRLRSLAGRRSHYREAERATALRARTLIARAARRAPER